MRMRGGVDWRGEEESFLKSLFVVYENFFLREVQKIVYV
jgi:hypothetical protein